MQTTSKLLDIAKNRRKTLKNKREERKIRKRHTTVIKIALVLLVYTRINILLENIF